MPLEVTDRFVERHIPAQSRQAAIQQHICLMSPETFGESERPGTSQTPSARVFGNGLEVLVTGEPRGRRLGPPTREPRVAVRGIADEGEPIGNGTGPHPEFCQHRRFVILEVSATVPTDHLGARHDLG